MRRLLFALYLISGAGMAYDLHIENSGKTLDQWLLFAANNPAFTSSDNAEANNPATKEKIVVNTPNAFISKNGLYFMAKNAKTGLVITIRKPSESDIPFLKSIAKEFGGVLVGDEGEEY